jgi:hypothetical protein
MPHLLTCQRQAYDHVDFDVEGSLTALRSKSSEASSEIFELELPRSGGGCNRRYVTMVTLVSVVSLVLVALATGMPKHQDQQDASQVANAERKNLELRGLADFLRSWPKQYSSQVSQLVAPQQAQPQYSQNVNAALAATQYVEQPQLQKPSNTNSALVAQQYTQYTGQPQLQNSAYLNSPSAQQQLQSLTAPPAAPNFLLVTPASSSAGGQVADGAEPGQEVTPNVVADGAQADRAVTQNVVNQPTATSGAASQPQIPGAVPLSTEAQPQCATMTEKVEYPGNDLGPPSISTSPEECCQQCAANYKCLAWSWVKSKIYCYLKGARPRLQLTSLSNDDAISGLPTQVGRSIPIVTRNPGQSMFCFSLMLPWGYEKGLLQHQYRRGASIFACDEYSVLSNQEILIADGLKTGIVKSDLKCKMGGEFKTCLNTPIFMKVWDKINADKRPQFHDWTVKVDPDAVFFPERLRALLVNHKETPKGVYLNNCKLGMHGPLEVFSRNAVNAWASGRWACVNHFKQVCAGNCKWGEDMFIDQCMMRVLKLQREFEPELLVEDHCKPPPGWADCKDARMVSFHPFKKQKAYDKCMDNAEEAASAKK